MNAAPMGIWPCKGNCAVAVNRFTPEWIATPPAGDLYEFSLYRRLWSRPQALVRLTEQCQCGKNHDTHHVPHTKENHHGENQTRDPKTAALRQQGCLNPVPTECKTPSSHSDFFDSRDLVQVKYEMVRRVRVDGQPVSHSAAAFGFSRPAFYRAQAASSRAAWPRWCRRNRGRGAAHKLSDEVVDFLSKNCSRTRRCVSAELAARVQKRFARKVHPRSVERACRATGKKSP